MQAFSSITRNAHRPVSIRGDQGLLFFAFILISSWTAGHAFADGGAIRYQGNSGPFHVTLFTLPAVMNAGLIDVTALVQDSATLVPLLDAEVYFDLSSNSASIQGPSAWSPPACAWLAAPNLNSIPARLNHGENKLLYGAMVRIPHSGRWDLQVRIQRGAAESVCNTSFNVNPPPSPPLAYWRLFIIPPIGVACFAFYQAARRKKGIDSKRLAARYV
jgi:hypothetical protein